MAEVDDPGKLLFSYDIDKCSRSDYVKMGRSIQLRNSKKMMVYSIAAIVVIIGLALALTSFVLILALAVVVEAVVYIEYSSRNIATKIEAKTPLHYDFFEDGLTETVGGNTELVWYNEIRTVNVSKSLYTLVCKKFIVVVPRSLLDEEAEKLMVKLRKLVVASHSKRHKH